jgi:hypothetical protein
MQENPAGWAGEEVSPFTQESLGISYPVFEVETLIIRAGRAMNAWKKVSVDDRAEVLIDSLERIKNRFTGNCLCYHAYYRSIVYDVFSSFRPSCQ